MRFKEGVRIDGIAPETIVGLMVAEGAYLETVGAIDKTAEMVVTSVRDGQHSAHSLHYRGLAADLRTRGIRTHLRDAWLSMVQRRLGFLGFDVVLEPDHIHVEFDPKYGPTRRGLDQGPDVQSASAKAGRPDRLAARRSP
jgi:hypothetical protein